MESKPLTTGRTPPKRQGQQYASVEEVAAAAAALTETDHAKLMMIAEVFCAKRKLPAEVIEPRELLHQAVLKTLSRDKRWYKEIPLVKHLDRAMENISGHMVRERLKGANRVVPFPDGLTPPEEKPGSDRTPELAADESIIVREDINAALAGVFGDDEIALKVFLKRVDGHQAGEIQSQLCLNVTQYEAISKRINRKTIKYLQSRV